MALHRAGRAYANGHVEIFNYRMRDECSTKAFS